MKIKKCVVFVFLLLGAVLLYGVQFEDVVIDPTNPLKINAGTNATGVYRSVTGGNAGSWNSYNTGLTSVAIYSLEVHPTDPAKMFAGTAAGGFHFSSNGGGNWIVSNTGLPANPFISALAHDPYLNGVIYAGEYNTGGVYKSNNNGANWTLVSFPWMVRDLAIDPVANVVVFAGTTAGLFRSMDSGANWTQVLPPVYDIHAIAIDPLNPTTIYAAGEVANNAVILKNVTGGDANSWTEVYHVFIPLLDGAHGYVSSLVVDPIVSSTVYAGTTGAGVLKSMDGGITWNPVNTNLFSLIVIALAIDHTSPAKLFAGTANGLFKTTSGGSNWFPVL